MIYVGIDTGVHTGFAIWDSRKRDFTEITSLQIHQAMMKVKVLFEEYGPQIKVRVEDPRQRTWFQSSKKTREEERKMLQGVGSVKRDASIWEDFLKDLGVHYEMTHPKNSITKMDAEEFKRVTGYTGKTNEHSRDAGFLVFGY
ncbi:MAG: hypothetical protein AB2L20_11810 [Mangrovibacterium sp.]